MTKLLIIEDDEKLGSELKSSLELHGFEVDLITNGEDGFYWLKEGTYPLAIVDWHLPRRSGVDVCRAYRAAGGKTRILMLTGSVTADSVVTGLEAGADEYVRKPVEFRELLARLNSLLRRPSAYKSNVIEIGIFKLDTAKRICWVNDTMLALPRREFAILEVLAQNPGHVFSAERIINCAWPTGSDTAADAIRVHVTRLRQRLNSVCNDAAKYLVNVYGEGYKFEEPTHAEADSALN